MAPSLPLSPWHEKLSRTHIPVSAKRAHRSPCSPVHQEWSAEHPKCYSLDHLHFPKLESQCVSARSSVTACRLAPLTCVLSFTTEPSTREHHLRHGAEMQANASVAYTLWGFPYFFELPLPTETQPLGGGRGSLSEWGHWAFRNCSPPVTMESRTSLCRDKWTCCRREPASKPAVEGVSNLGS